MEEIQRSTRALIWERIKEREKWVFILFAFAFIAIPICKLITASCILDCISCIHSFIEIHIHFLSEVKKLLYTFALSYVSGVIVYYLTVILPEAQRSKPILAEIENTLKFLIDEFDEFAQKLQIGDLNNVDEVAEKAFTEIQQYGKTSENQYNLKFCKLYFIILAKELDHFVTISLEQSSVLTLDELNTIVFKIRKQKVSERLRCNYGIDNCLTAYDMKQYMKDIGLLYVEISQFRKKLRNRIYEQ